MLGGIVRGKRTLLRVPTEADLDGIARWAADMRVRGALTHAYWDEPAMHATWKERLAKQSEEKTSVLGPRLEGEHGVALVPLTLDHVKRNWDWMTVPETTRFWGVRAMDLRPEHAEERFKKLAADRDNVNWTIAFEGEQVGMTGLFDINWITRDAESGIFIGRHDLYGKGIASEAIRLRTTYAWQELRLRRVHNWIAVRNRGSRRANEKAGYRQMGRYPRSWFRSGQWHDEWLGEIFAPGEEPPGWV